MTVSTTQNAKGSSEKIVSDMGVLLRRSAQYRVFKVGDARYFLASSIRSCLGRFITALAKKGAQAENLAKRILPGTCRTTKIIVAKNDTREAIVAALQLPKAI